MMNSIDQRLERLKAKIARESENRMSTQELDMDEKIFTRKDFDTLTKILTKHGPLLPGNIPNEWQVRLSPKTFVTIKFTGPVGFDEWRELIGQLHRYKAWFKDIKVSTLTVDDLVDEIVARLSVDRPNEPAERAQSVRGEDRK